MSKAILEFNLPEESEEFKTANNANKYHAVISDLLKEMRDSLKYESPFLDKPYKEVGLEDFRTRLFELLDEHKVLEDF